ncbi:hypothetical protein VQ643_04250 [Pseudomonas sp. F1_0610]|uniref:hypothetical protein n=1 Tax=Pseudomonas sp. F1_0610 TaxID=3114284 RepID=UPI0039C4781D
MNWRAWLMVSAFYALTLLASYWVGQWQGASEQQLKHERQNMAAIEQLLARSQQQIDAANQASNALLKQMQSRAKQDQQTTKELHDALAKTAANRTDCNLPDDVMQYLYQARDRASAATTRSTVNPVPSTRQPAQ